MFGNGLDPCPPYRQCLNLSPFFPSGFPKLLQPTKKLLIIAGNVKEKPGPVNRMEATKQELEPGKCKICAKTFRGAIGLSV